MERVLPQRLYLDHAATTAMTSAARAGLLRGVEIWANPSSPHAEGREARAALEQARKEIGAAYGWTGEILLTSGASESLWIALRRSIGGRRLVSRVEHDAAMRAAGERVDFIDVAADGRVCLTDLRNRLALGAAGDAMTAAERPLVCIQWCNSETGVLQPIADIAQIVHEAGGLLLVDAAQMPASPALADLADFVALSAHKRGGPPGIGALLVRNLATLVPTGGQERGYRAGTENLPAALGYAAALDEPEPDHTTLRQRLDDAVRRSGGIVVGEGSPRHPAIGSYRLPGVSANAQLIRLDLEGIAVSAGSACASGSLKPSHVLRAMRWTEEDTREVIRVSFGRNTTEADIERFIQAWRKIARGARMLAA
ncbi:cysteine desulfurase [Sphingomonas sp. OV641]|uniref:cysteine desulfurase family protein n=1 Tax=Sphingomonas sp. OV641 TaxID=1881068 RepID=UPI0008BA5BF9|nr:aminotransferase class V-fold PLP-dependent enzyme [Sphingomonas sp. OV641]SEI85763.1 cysteine desulfurase [Sphingomonas sp. OV641]